MDLQDQLKALFPDHQPSEEEKQIEETEDVSFYIHSSPTLGCVYEKRKGKPHTIIENYQGAQKDFKALSSTLKSKFKVGGSFKNESIVIQGDRRDEIMNYLKALGFTVKRIGG